MLVSSHFTSDLTGQTVDDQNHSALTDVAAYPEIRIESRLPEDWIPEGAGVVICAHRLEDDQWEALSPEYSIAGKGASAEDALENVFELVEDYLLLCHAEGKMFDDCFRGISRKTLFPMLRELAHGLVAAKWRNRHDHQRPRDDQRYRLPLRSVGVH